ncbi:methionine--tRNA ligase, partial [Omnitrophica bacterium]|nr:methionine--tRNA ligase [Candidatus Omnitrophota bacterium]
LTKLNQSIEEHKPWVMAKEPSRKGELANVLAVLAEWMAHTAVLLQPFLPQSAGMILSGLGIEKEWVMTDGAAFAKPLLKAGQAIKKGEALFPRLEEE